MLTVWGRKTSSNVQALMWSIGELGLACTRHDVGGRFGGLDSTSFRELNPNMTVPVLRDGSGPPIWETGCILRYLGNLYAPATYWPDNLAARTEVDQWAEWSKINVALAFTVPVFWRVVRTKVRDDEAIDEAVTSLECALAIADRRLCEQKFLVGDTLTLADIQFGHVLFRYYDIEIKRAPLLNLQRYYRELTKRPAFAEHVMVSYEELLP